MLTFIPTPIGNLADISFRALESLKDCKIILCEDTRVTKKLINLINEKLNYKIDLDKRYISVHSHNEEKYISLEYINIYKKENVAYLSDAGMPCVSDPGALLVQACINNGIDYDVLPGANALLTAYAMSGFNQKEFTFFGFLPHKTINRKSPLHKIMNSEFLTIIYESTHRIKQLIDEINAIDENKQIFLVKELTKIYQTTYKGTVKSILNKFDKIDTRGEWVVVIDSVKNNNTQILTVDDISTLQLPPKQKAKLLSKLTGKNIKEVYNSLIN